MSWLERLGRGAVPHYLWWIVCAIALLTLAQSAWRPPTSLDAFWHLRMGHDWLFEGLSPWVDHYSFTYAGEAITSPPYLFQAALAGLVEGFGLNGGLAAWRTGMLMLAALAMMLWCRQVRAPLAAACIGLATVVLLAQLRNIARPELLSLTLSLVMLMLTRRAGLKFGWREVWPVAALFWFWCNYHAPVFGYIVAFGWFVDGAIEKLQRRASFSEWRQWMLAGAAVTAVGFINPEWHHPMLTIVSYSSEWSEHIQEYQVPLLHAQLWGIYIALGVATLTLAMIVQQRRFGYLVVWLVLIYNALLVARLVTPAGIIIAALFVDLASRAPLFTQWREWTIGRQRTALAAVVLAVLLPAASSANLAYSYWQEQVFANQLYPGTYRYPADVADYMRDAGITGRIFNVFDAGGFLVWHATPDVQVYIDGRTEILYPFEHFQRAHKVLQSADALRKELDEHQIDTAILDNALGTHVLAYQTGIMSLEYAGTKYSLFTRGAGKLKDLAHLQARPACAGHDTLHSLDASLTNASRQVQEHAPLRSYLKLLDDFRRAPDRSAFIAEVKPNREWGDESLRFAGYRALEFGHYAHAYDLFLQLRQREPKDLMAGMLAKLELDEPADAEALAEIASRTRWPRLDVEDVLLMRGLLEAIDARLQLTKVDPDFVSALESELNRVGAAGIHPPLDVSSFCKVHSKT